MKKLEYAANVAIILVAAILSFILVSHYITARRSVTHTHALPATEIEVGAKVPLDGVKWSDSDRTVLLILSSGCPHCSENQLLYQQLSRQVAATGNTKIIAIFPSSDSGVQEYIDQMGMIVNEVRQAPLNSLNIVRLPAILFVNRDGIVTRTWFGTLNENKQSELLAELGKPRNELDSFTSSEKAVSDKSSNVDPQYLIRMIQGNPKVIILDVRNRENYSQGHIPGAKNIPADELDIRAERELLRTHLIVVYDDGENEMGSAFARRILSDKEFHRVLTLSNGIIGWKSEGLPLTK